MLAAGKEQVVLTNSYARIPEGSFNGENTVDAFWVDRAQVSGESTAQRKGSEQNTETSQFNGIEANNVCRAKGMRLPTPLEWQYVAYGEGKVIHHYKKFGWGGNSFYMAIGDDASANTFFWTWNNTKINTSSNNSPEFTYDPDSHEYNLCQITTHFSRIGVLSGITCSKISPTSQLINAAFRCASDSEPQQPRSRVCAPKK